MRQNIFLLSAACFYFLMQTANLALGTPATPPLNTDKDTSIAITIGDSDESRTVLRRSAVGSRALEKRAGLIRSNLGQALCGVWSEKQSHEEVVNLYKLYTAYCVDDKQYNVECREYIPYTEEPLYDDDSCHQDEICKTREFKNAWGVLKTEVYCQRQESVKAEWGGASILKSNCSPGIIAHDQHGTKMGLSSQFYSNGFRTNRAAVAHAWFQSNKRGRIAENYHANGLYVQALMQKDETIQACFVRATDNDAKYAYLIVAEEDL